MERKVMHEFNVVKKLVDITTKNWISGSKKFLIYTLTKIHNRGKIHDNNSCGC